MKTHPVLAAAISAIVTLGLCAQFSAHNRKARDAEPAAIVGITECKHLLTQAIITHGGSIVPLPDMKLDQGMAITKILGAEHSAMFTLRCLAT